jgi:hypothetical protein
MSIDGIETTRRLSKRRATPTAGPRDSSFVIRRRKRFWEVIDPSGELVCLTVYKRGAFEVVRRFALDSSATPCLGLPT